MSFGRDTEAVGPFCLVSVPGEVKDPTPWKKPVVDSVRPIELVISIFKRTLHPGSLAVMSCLGYISYQTNWVEITRPVKPVYQKAS